MSIESRIRSYESVFHDWKVKEYLGGGSGGQTGVYRIVRPHGSWEEVGALKVITIVEAKGKFQEQSESFQQDYLRHRQQLRTKADRALQRQKEKRQHEKNLRMGKVRRDPNPPKAAEDAPASPKKTPSAPPAAAKSFKKAQPAARSGSEEKRRTAPSFKAGPGGRKLSGKFRKP